MDPYLQQILALTIVAAIVFNAIVRFLWKRRKGRYGARAGCSGCGEASHCPREKSINDQ